MSALQAVSLEEAKVALAIDFPDHDTLITQLIGTAVSMVEARTQHYLYERTESLYLRGHGEFYHYPLKINRVENEDSVAVEYRAIPYSLYSKVKTYADTPSTVNATIGYASAEAIPGPLKTAVLRLVVYLFENRDIQTVEMPTDVYMLIRPFVRYASI